MDHSVSIGPNPEEVSWYAAPATWFDGNKLWCILPRDVGTFNFLPTNGLSIKPLKVNLLAGGAESHRA